MTNQFPKSCSQRVAFFSARSISASMLGVIRLISSINNTSRAHTRHRSTEVARLLAVIWRLFSHSWTLHSIHHGMSHVADTTCEHCAGSAVHGLARQVQPRALVTWRRWPGAPCCKQSWLSTAQEPQHVKTRSRPVCSRMLQMFTARRSTR